MASSLDLASTQLCGFRYRDPLGAPSLGFTFLGLVLLPARRDKAV